MLSIGGARAVRYQDDRAHNIIAHTVHTVTRCVRACSCGFFPVSKYKKKKTNQKKERHAEKRRERVRDGENVNNHSGGGDATTTTTTFRATLATRANPSDHSGGGGGRALNGFFFRIVSRKTERIRRVREWKTCRPPYGFRAAPSWPRSTPRAVSTHDKGGRSDARAAAGSATMSHTGSGDRGPAADADD